MGTSIQMAFLTLSLLPSDITISNSCFQDSQMSPLTGLTLTHAPFSLLSLSLKDWGCANPHLQCTDQKAGTFCTLSFFLICNHTHSSTRLLFTRLLWNVIMGHLYSWRLPPPSPNKCSRRSNLASGSSPPRPSGVCPVLYAAGGSVECSGWGRDTVYFGEQWFDQSAQQRCSISMRPAPCPVPTAEIWPPA